MEGEASIAGVAIFGPIQVLNPVRILGIGEAAVPETSQARGRVATEEQQQNEQAVGGETQWRES